MNVGSSAAVNVRRNSGAKRAQIFNRTRLAACLPSTSTVGQQVSPPPYSPCRCRTARSASRASVQCACFPLDVALVCVLTPQVRPLKLGAARRNKAAGRNTTPCRLRCSNRRNDCMLKIATVKGTRRPASWVGFGPTPTTTASPNYALSSTPSSPSTLSWSEGCNLLVCGTRRRHSSYMPEVRGDGSRVPTNRMRPLGREVSRAADWLTGGRHGHGIARETRAFTRALLSQERRFIRRWTAMD